MSYRFMRMIVFFNLPTETDSDKKEYRRFRKVLIKNGFMMLQESVYCRMVLNASVQNSVATLLEREKPAHGLVQLLTVTEKQFASMKFIVGSHNSDIIDSDERTVFL